MMVMNLNIISMKNNGISDDNEVTETGQVISKYSDYHDSNVGAQELQDQRFFGFGGGSEGHDYETIRKTMMKELKNSFRQSS